MKAVRILVDDGKDHEPHRHDALIVSLARSLRELVRERKCDRIAESRIGFKHTPQAIQRMSEIKKRRDAEARGA